MTKDENINNEKSVEEILKESKSIMDSMRFNYQTFNPILEVLKKYSTLFVGSIAFIVEASSLYELSMIKKTGKSPIKSQKRYQKELKDNVPPGFLMTSLSYAMSKGLEIEWLRAYDTNINNLYIDIEKNIKDIDLNILNIVLKNQCSDLMYMLNCHYNNELIDMSKLNFGSYSPIQPTSPLYGLLEGKEIIYYPFLFVDFSTPLMCSFNNITLKSKSIIALIYSEFVECNKANLRLTKCISCNSLMFVNTQQKYCHYCDYPSETKEEARLRKQVERIIKNTDMITQVEMKLKTYMEVRNYSESEINRQVRLAKDKFKKKEGKSNG